MTTLLYDGSVEGLFTAVFEVFEYRYTLPEIISSDKYRTVQLFADTHEVVTDAMKAGRVLKKLDETIGKNGIRKLLYVHFSELPGAESLILSAVRQAVKQQTGDNVMLNYANGDIMAISKICKSVEREIHRLHAFVRFEKLSDGTFYAKVQPDFNVLPLGFKFFTDRYQDQKWMIYDVKRQFGVAYDLMETTFFQPEGAMLAALGDPRSIHHDEEAAYQRLWQRYFTKTNIVERRNVKLHVQHVPKRYWQYLTEKWQ